LLNRIVLFVHIYYNYRLRSILNSLS
jgi:hypothetical protein